MKKFFAMILALCMLLCCTCASASTFDMLQDMLRNSSSSAPAAQAPAAQEAEPESFLVTDCMDGLGVGKHHVFTMDSTNYVYVYLYLEVTNNGDRAVEVDGEIEVMDLGGTVVEDQSYLYAYPSVIAPGEVAYVAEYVMVSKSGSVSGGESIGQVKLNLFRDAYNREPQLPTYTQSAAEVGTGVNSYGYEVPNTFRVAVINNTGADLNNPYVVAAMYDADDQLLYVDIDAVEGFDSLTIPNGNGFMISGAMSSSMSEYLAEQGLSVSTIKSVAYGY